MKKFLVVMVLLFVHVMLFAEDKTNPFNFSGYFWVDQGYMQAENRLFDGTSPGPSNPDREQFYQAGRFVLAVGYIRELGNLYAKARTSFAVNSNYYSNPGSRVDRFAFIPLDAYVEVGVNDLFGIGNLLGFRVGRFEGFELYHMGMGLDQYSDERLGVNYNGRMIDIYELNAVRGYFHAGQGQAAAHFFFQDILKFELAGLFGVDDSFFNHYGVRPVVDISTRSLFSMVPFKIVAGLEWTIVDPSSTIAISQEATTFGYGGRVQLDEMPLPFLNSAITLGFNYTNKNFEQLVVRMSTAAPRLVDNTNSGDTISYGFFLNYGFLDTFVIGGGYHMSEYKNYSGTEITHRQPFLAAQYFTPVEGLSVKGVLGVGTEGNYPDEKLNAKLTSFRLRVEYEF